MKRIASVVLLAGACGQVHALADAGDHDTGSGSDAADAPPALTKVKATVRGPNGLRAPSTGIPVVFANADGSVAAQATSDVDGKVEAELPDGGSVTAVWPNGNGFVVETIAGAKPGDDLTLIGEGIDATPAGSFTVSWAPRAGTSMYFVYTSCGLAFAESNATSAVAAIQAYCERDTMTVAVAAFDSSGLIGYEEQRDVAFHDGGHLDLGNAWIDARQVDVAITGLSAADEGSLFFDRFNTDVFGYDAGGSAAVAAATANLAIGAPASAGRAIARTQIERSIAGADSVQVFEQPIDGGSLTYSFDVGAHLLPWVGLPVLDPATATITVPRTGAGAPDFAVVGVGYQHAGKTIDWVVIAPDVDRPIVLPSLDPIADVGPVAGDTFIPSAGSTMLVESDAIAGYDAARADAFATRLLAVTGRSTAALTRVSAAIPSN